MTPVHSLRLRLIHPYPYHSTLTLLFVILHLALPTSFTAQSSESTQLTHVQHANPTTSEILSHDEPHPFVCGGVVGDPEFIGFRGQRFEIHGVPDAIFNIITSPLLQYNAQFVWLGSATNNTCDEERTTGFSHPGTYLGSIGIQVGSEKIRLVPGNCTAGISLVQVDEKVLELNDVHHFKAGHRHQRLTYLDEFTVKLELTEVVMTFTNSDRFFNQEVSLTEYGQKTHELHGLLGQTWSATTYRDENGHRHFIEGHPVDYLLQMDDLFSNEFKFNMFPTN